MWSVLFQQSGDELALALWECGTCGVVEENGNLRAHFSGRDAEQQVRLLASRFGGVEIREEADSAPPPTIEPLDPILIGKRFFVGQRSTETTASDGRLAITINSTSAFGTGRHETTQLCLEALERVLQPTDVVLDIGCGSGILSLGALLLGASQIISCDIFEGAIAAARQNIQTPVFIGSADAIASGSANLILANLTGSVLDRLARDLQRITKPNGRLVISGFLSDAPPACFHPEESTSQGDWLCWVCRPERVVVPEGNVPASGLTHAPDWWL